MKLQIACSNPVIKPDKCLYTSEKGLIALYYVLGDILQRGFIALQSAEGAIYDALIDCNSRFFRVQVKGSSTYSFGAGGGGRREHNNKFSKYKDKIDVFAFCDFISRRIFYVPIITANFLNKSSVSFDANQFTEYQSNISWQHFMNIQE